MRELNELSIIERKVSYIQRSTVRYVKYLEVTLLLALIIKDSLSHSNVENKVQSRIRIT